MESAIKLAERFIAGVTKPVRLAADPSTINHQPQQWRPKSYLPGASRGFFLFANPFASLCVFRELPPSTFPFQLPPLRRIIARLIVMGSTIANLSVGQAKSAL